MNAPLRGPAVAGLFYPGEPGALDEVLRRCLPDAAPAQAPVPKALIVPHAGYIYSGSTAGAAFARLAPARERIRRVVLLGPTHRVAVRGLALPSVTAFATPLGELPLDTAGIRALAERPFVQLNDAAHAQEHSLEVQLPFLQRVLAPGFTLLPIAVGDAREDEVAAVIEQVWGGEETVIVVSSDLSHYHPYDEARQRDGATVAQILALRPLTSFDQACGALPINGLLAVARRKRLRIECVAQCNSGDTAGDQQRVVGYAAFALRELDQDAWLGRALLARARAAIAGRFGVPLPVPEGPNEVLSQPGASFVTLMLDGQLRGCIGSLQAMRTLADDVAANAVAAAERDPRFTPLTQDEFARVKVEVSLLAPPEPLHVATEAEAIARLRPGIDGVIFEAAGRRSTFLPQVWEQLPDPATFLAHLRQKAGLPADYWSDAVRLSRYTVRKWKE